MQPGLQRAMALCTYHGHGDGYLPMLVSGPMALGLLGGRCAWCSTRFCLCAVPCITTIVVLYGIVDATGAAVAADASSFWLFSAGPAGRLSRRNHHPATPISVPQRRPRQVSCLPVPVSSSASHARAGPGAATAATAVAAPGAGIDGSNPA